MAFYDLSKEERTGLVDTIKKEILEGLLSNQLEKIISYFGNEDTYIRKSAYLSVGRIYFENENLQKQIIIQLFHLLQVNDYKIRQTVINAAGEIGKKDFEAVRFLLEQGLFDLHHSPRNAVIGSIKKMGEVNPEPILEWVKNYLQHEDKEIRREICHGLELRGREHPEEILPLLKELQYDKSARVCKTLVHVIGQISYKKGCLQIVVEHLKNWDNKQLVSDALAEIIDVHDRYKDFSALTQEEARQCIISVCNVES